MNKKTINAFVLSRKMVAAGLISTSLLVQSCGGDGSPRIKDSVEKTVYESTKGVVTEVEEVEPGNEYKIIDERIIDEKEKSIAIVHTLEGTTDTLSLRTMKDESSSNGSYRHSGLRSILLYSLAGSFFNRNLGSVSPNANNYKTPGAYEKSTGLKNDLKSSATTRRVRVPGSSSTGYGKGKSFRSFGG
ncbi:hypothetical protein ACFSTE_06070 [Aquimarina hainanensis]|uniref:UPF0323 domain-containing protein n=1 Tax=Aquimarina hainanensis TaxID=1578017 RepID=A0ABW5N5J1_9FLAO|nr:hypothetical protein [Aquimarina sp. TRL1]QKX04769.1 hypothetical protein HN014_07525 [Aquimarina sp. TRL1]